MSTKEKEVVEEDWEPLKNGRKVTYKHTTQPENKNQTRNTHTVIFLENNSPLIELVHSILTRHDDTVHILREDNWRWHLQSIIDDFIQNGINIGIINYLDSWRTLLDRTWSNKRDYAVRYFFNGYNVCCEHSAKMYLTVNNNGNIFNTHYYYIEIPCKKNIGTYKFLLEPIGGNSEYDGKFYTKARNISLNDYKDKPFIDVQFQHNNTNNYESVIKESNQNETIISDTKISKMSIPDSIYTKINTIDYLNKINFFSEQYQDIYPKVDEDVKVALEKGMIFGDVKIKSINDNGVLHIDN